MERREFMTAAAVAAGGMALAVVRAVRAANGIDGLPAAADLS